jgi:hypothetical protein
MAWTESLGVEQCSQLKRHARAELAGRGEPPEAWHDLVFFVIA